VTSPARRCIQTLDAIWPDQAARPRRSAEPRLWEQDFGAWEGVAYDKLPDLGALSLAALAAHRPPGGESFADVCARTQAALADMLASRRGQTLCLCAHAGSIRAALALALGAVSAALCFRIDYLSLTVLRHFGDARWSVDGVNQSLPA
ncbi:MAG: histidine phosphatase family protein, partial [Alphaproteobacteria bacterium]